MTSINFRQHEILAIARQTGKVTVDDLAERFDVTPQTIRKDLNDLCEQRLLTRTHGGALLSSGVENVAYEARRQLAAESKSSGSASARRSSFPTIPRCSSISAPRPRKWRARSPSMRACSSSPTISMSRRCLTPWPGIDVIVVGGMVRRTDGGIVGEAAVDFIRQFKVDYAVIGVSAIDDDGALLDFDYREVRAAQAIIANAQARHPRLRCDEVHPLGAGAHRPSEPDRHLRHRPAAARADHRYLPTEWRGRRSRSLASRAKLELAARRLSS